MILIAPALWLVALLVSVAVTYKHRGGAKAVIFGLLYGTGLLFCALFLLIADSSFGRGFFGGAQALAIAIPSLTGLVPGVVRTLSLRACESQPSR